MELQILKRQTVHWTRTATTREKRPIFKWIRYHWFRNFLSIL